MRSYIAFFRGINVGGRNVLPMRELAALLGDIGARDVKTYIQSGNAVFLSEETDASFLSEVICAEIGKRHGFTPRVLLMESERLESAVSSNPFPDAESEPRSLHLFFLASTPESPDLGALESARSGSERFALRDRVFYLHAPDGVGRSKLAANVERVLGAPVTARNWRTVRKVMELSR